MDPVNLVLDTDITMYYFRGGAVARTIEAEYGLRRPGFRPVISAVTIGEAYAFARNPDWDPSKRARFLDHLAQFTVIEVNVPEVLEAYAPLHEAGARSGRNIGHNDLWIAATANALGVPVMTADKDLARLPAGMVDLIRIDAKTGRTI